LNGNQQAISVFFLIKLNKKKKILDFTATPSKVLKFRLHRSSLTWLGVVPINWQEEGYFL
jgi:hypothetical protein